MNIKILILHQVNMKLKDILIWITLKKKGLVFLVDSKPKIIIIK